MMYEEEQIGQYNWTTECAEGMSRGEEKVKSQG